MKVGISEDNACLGGGDAVWEMAPTYFKGGQVLLPATSVATRTGKTPFLKSEMTLFRSLWSMSPCSNPRSWSSCLRLLASSSAFAFLVTNRRTLPEEVYSTK